MNKEEKKAVIFLKHYLEDDDVFKIANKDLRIILNLIEKQQKELEQEKNKINTIKKIMSIGDITDEALFALAQTIMAELGRLEDIEEQLEQEKEKNKDLEEKLKIAVAMLTKGTYPEENEGDNDFNKKFIAVDKIKEKMEEIMNYTYMSSEERQQQNYAYDRLKELLEEK